MFLLRVRGLFANVSQPGAYGAHVWLQPTSPSARIANAGDMTVTPGIWTAAILAQPAKSQGKYACVSPETLSYAECLDIWAEVTGKRAVFVKCTVEEFTKVWGPPGEEFAAQLAWGEVVEDWTSGLPGGFVGMEELGIRGEGIGHRAALERIKGMGLL